MLHLISDTVLVLPSKRFSCYLNLVQLIRRAVMLINIISLLASIFTVITLIPQVYKTYKSKSTRDLSSFMLYNFCFVSILWITYGLMIGAKTLWITNIMTLISSTTLVYFKILYCKKNGKVKSK